MKGERDMPKKLRDIDHREETRARRRDRRKEPSVEPEVFAAQVGLRGINLDNFEEIIRAGTKIMRG